MPAETHSHRGAIDTDDVRMLVIDRLAEVLGRDLDELTMDSRLREDLDADDFAIIDVCDAIEEELGERTVSFHLEDEELFDVISVGDLIEIVVAKCAQ